MQSRWGLPLSPVEVQETTHYHFLPMKISDEVFVIPSGDEYLLYVPLLGNVLRANLATVSLLQRFADGTEIEPSLKAKLIKGGLLVDAQPHSPAEAPPQTDFAPTHVTLFTTSDCNLRCIYCYARGGLRQHVMKWKHAKAAIDFVIENAVRTQAKTSSETQGFFAPPRLVLAG